MIRHALTGLTALCLLGACNGKPPEQSANAPKELSFAILSAESQQSMGKLWEPLLADLSKQTGVTVKPVFTSNYTGQIEAMRFNNVQVGWFSALPALEAVRRAQGQVLGRVAAADGAESYESVLIVRKGSGITLDQVFKCDKRLTFGMGDAKSTSGTLAPMAYLFVPKDIEPSACFKTVRSANHQTNLFSVASGVLDVATNNSGSFCISTDRKLMASTSRTPPHRTMSGARCSRLRRGGGGTGCAVDAIRCPGQPHGARPSWRGSRRTPPAQQLYGQRPSSAWRRPGFRRPPSRGWDRGSCRRRT